VRCVRISRFERSLTDDDVQIREDTLQRMSGLTPLSKI
jgi:hypothetical protein